MPDTLAISPALVAQLDTLSVPQLRTAACAWRMHRKQVMGYFPANDPGASAVKGMNRPQLYAFLGGDAADADAAAVYCLEHWSAAYSASSVDPAPAPLPAWSGTQPHQHQPTLVPASWAPAPAAPAPEPVASGNDDAARKIREILGIRETAPVDRGTVLAIIGEALDPLRAQLEELASRPVATPPAPIIVAPAPGLDPKPFSPGAGDHPGLKKAILWLAIGSNVALFGPSGTGKTFNAEKLAGMMGLPFYGFSLGPTSCAQDLLGFLTASGTYTGAAFVRAFREGGVVMLDELDAAHGDAIIALNSALANGFITLPNGETVRRHENFRLIAGMNTNGLGATRAMSQRKGMDGPARDRLVFISWDYDLALEDSIAATNAGPLGTLWARTVQAYRAAMLAATPGCPHVISYRATIEGSRFLAMAATSGALPLGEAWDEVLEACLWKGLGTQDRKTITNHANATGYRAPSDSELVAAAHAYRSAVAAAAPAAVNQ